MSRDRARRGSRVLCRNLRSPNSSTRCPFMIRNFLLVMADRVPTGYSRRSADGGKLDCGLCPSELRAGEAFCGRVHPYPPGCGPHMAEFSQSRHHWKSKEPNVRRRLPDDVALWLRLLVDLPVVGYYLAALGCGQRHSRGCLPSGHGARRRDVIRNFTKFDRAQ